jgi:hypothetical protein
MGCADAACPSGGSTTDIIVASSGIAVDTDVDTGGAAATGAVDHFANVYADNSDSDSDSDARKSLEERGDEEISKYTLIVCIKDDAAAPTPNYYSRSHRLYLECQYEMEDAAVSGDIDAFSVARERRAAFFKEAWREDEPWCAEELQIHGSYVLGDQGWDSVCEEELGNSEKEEGERENV